MSKILNFREKLNLTQEELSTKSGISARTIQRIEAGKIPKGFTLKALAKALDVTENALTESDEQQPILNYNLFKIINISSLPFIILPPLNIVVPLLILYFKKEKNPLMKKVVSLQILWTVFALVVFCILIFIKKWLHTDNSSLPIFMIALILLNMFIILRNQAELDRNKKLFITLNFNLI